MDNGYLLMKSIQLLRIIRTKREINNRIELIVETGVDPSK